MPRRRAPLLAALLLLAPPTALARDPALARAPYLDPRLPVERRVADLLRRMTLEEKVAQLQAHWRPKTNVLVDERGVFAPGPAEKLLALGLGQVARPSENEQPARSLGARAGAELANAIQRHVIERTRLGIPVMFHEEGLHGLAEPGGTSFPQPLALAASFDPALVEKVMAVVAVEMRARGAHQALAPVVDVARDPRWGRTEETFGEDPHLVGRLGAAVVRGFQGRGPRIGERSVIATVKHFAVHSQPEGGINVAPNNHSERTIREVFLPPFHAALVEAGALSLMPSYNEVDGIPSHVNRWLLDDVLRGEWKWNGFVVSDYDAVEQLETLHGVAADREDAARQALLAGIDVELPNPYGFRTLAEQVRAKQLPIAAVDRAVARVLRAKLLLGLFERPFVDPAAAEQITGSAAHAELARVAAERSIVLLKNEAKLLPLDRARLGTIAVIGPNGAPCRLGGYSGVPPRCIGLLDGIKRAVGPKTKVLHGQGCWITKSNDWTADEVEGGTAEEDARLIREAVEAARRAEVVVLALGDSEQTSREAWSKGHLGDRPSLALFGRQDELARAVLAVGKPTVVVLQNGRPPAIGELAARAPAIVEGFYLGQEGGVAIANVLFGVVNPGGKLPITMARSAGHLPAFYNHKPSARRGYLHDEVSPLFPFGHGLSYTTFAYGPPRVSPPRGTAAAPEVTVSVDVTNTGARPGDEVVQLYLRDVKSSVTRPVKELRGFERVALGPGERRTVTFTLRRDALGFWKDRRTFVVEPGRFDVMTGGSSAAVQSASFELGRARTP